MIISDRWYAPHDWSNSYMCVTVRRRLDMSKFTEGDWQRVLKANSKRVVQTGKPSSGTEKINSLREFLQGRRVFVNLPTG